MGDSNDHKTLQACESFGRRDCMRWCGRWFS